MTHPVNVICADRYEAEKLAGLTSVQKDGSIFIDSIAAIHDAEIVLRLKDKSSHSVELRDKTNVKTLETVLRNILSQKLVIKATRSDNEMVQILVE
jgi:hypothetical protein